MNKHMALSLSVGVVGGVAVFLSGNVLSDVETIAMLKELDENGDGEVSKSEFVSWTAKLYRITACPELSALYPV